jgi:hypothetical protein
VAPPIRALAGLYREEFREAGPLALVGRRSLVDAVAAALLAGGGERRLLAPLDRPVVSELRRCSGVVACGLDIAHARLVGHARRPWVALLAEGQDRYDVGVLPFLGAENAVATVGEVPARLVRVLDREVAASLAARLPALRPHLSAHLERDAALRAAAVAAFGPPTLLALPVARATMADAHARGISDPRGRAAAIVAAATAGALVARSAGGPARRAAAGYAAGLALIRTAGRLHA